MIFYSFTDEARNALFFYEKQTVEEQATIMRTLHQKVKKCPYKVYLIGNNIMEQPSTSSRLDLLPLLSDLHKAWKIINGDKPTKTSLLKSIEFINSISEKISLGSDSYSFTVRRFKPATFQKAFFILVGTEDKEGIPLESLRLLCNLWQIEQGKIPMHSSAVIHKGSIFLFSGPSSAGKSTISQLSLIIGDQVLDEDQILIYRKPDRSFSANAWGYSLQKCSISIKGFFRLIKNPTDQIRPLSITRTAHLMMEQSFTISGKSIPDNSFKLLSHRIAELARSIPGYELYFRKTPDFWNLIDEEFSLV